MRSRGVTGPGRLPDRQDTRFAVLGTLRVLRGGLEVPIPTRQPQVLLAALLLHANEIMSADRLTELLWADLPPATARTVLHNNVMRLRRALGPGIAPRIQTRSSSYVMEVQDGELDLHRFMELRDQGRVAFRDANWDEAADRLRAALSLWDAEPLCGLDAPALRSAELPGLIEAHLQALEWRVEADLRRGLHADLIAELRRLSGAHPFRERFREQLLLALYRCGSRAEALAAYQDARRLLVDELGVEPGPGLQHLHQRILAADPELLAEAGSAMDGATQDEPDSDAGQFPGGPPGGDPANTRLTVTPRQLPAAARHFVGRAAELQVLSVLLDTAAGTPAISVISGTAGVGKTTLAIQWAHQVADHFPDGQLYVNLRAFDPSGKPVEPAEAVPCFLAALGVPAERMPAGLDQQVGLCRSLLAGRRMLMVLDNALDEAQVRPLLPGSGSCAILVTTRRELTGLAVTEGAALLRLEVLAADEAHELLVRCLGAARAAGEDAAARELIEMCARLPLALSILGARAVSRPGLALSALAAELREVRSRLDALDVGDPASSVRTVFSWSYQKLSSPAARMFRLLAVHPGPDVSAPAAASLVGRPLPQACRLLGELTRSHLVTEHMPGRFAFHDLLRVYANEKASSRDSGAERRSAMHRMLDHYLHTAHAAALILHPAREPLALDPAQPGTTPEHLADYEQALAWFEAERNVLDLVIRQAAEAGFDAHCWQIPWTLATFSDMQGYVHEWAAIQKIGLAAAERLGNLAGQAQAHRRVGAACMLLGQYDDAHAHLGLALDLERQLGHSRGQAAIHLDLGRAFDRQGEYRAALRHVKQAASLYREAGHPMGEADALNAVGWCYAQLGEHEHALDCCGQAVALQRELGDRRGEAATWDSLGYIQHHLGRHADAATCYQRALELLSVLGDRRHLAETLTHLGDCRHASGDPEGADQAWRQALTILDDLDHPFAEQVRSRLRRSTSARS
jgi:DNA-binding SARP family transcriptional activator